MSLDSVEQTEAPPAPWRARQMVYFLEAGPFVKIGYTNGIKTRLNDLQVGCPYKQRLLATLPGDERLEHQIHDLAEDYHARAEWFHHKGRLKQWIAGANVTRSVTYEDGETEYCFKEQLAQYDEFDAYLRSVGQEPMKRTIGSGLRLERQSGPVETLRKPARL